QRQRLVAHVHQGNVEPTPGEPHRVTPGAARDVERAPAGGQVGGERDEPGRRLVGDGMVARPPALVPPPAVVGRHAQLLAFSLRRNWARSASVGRCWLSRAHRSAKSRACAAVFFTSTLAIGPTVPISAWVTRSSSFGASVTTGGGACPAGGVRV